MPSMMRRVASALLALLMFIPAVAADALDDIRQRGTLRWGADQEGGGPYIYPDPRDPNKVIGFEVELMQLIGERLGVRDDFKQGEWTNLPDMLRRDDIDVIVNGYELTPERLDAMAATIPYYIYELQLIARKDDPAITSWNGLNPAEGKKELVGVLTGSAPEKYLLEHFGAGVELRNYNGNTDAMLDVQNGRLDATVQDLPIAIFYKDRFPKLHFVDKPVGEGFYVMYLKKGPNGDRLREALNAALLDLIQNGRLQTLYENYGLWNKTQQRLGTPGLGLLGTEHAATQKGMDAVTRNLPILLRSAGMTVLLSCLSMPLAIAIGLCVALGRLYGPPPLGWLLTLYVEIVRGTPLLFQLLTIYYVLPPAFGIYLDPIPAAVLGLAINYSAYEAEIYRAGLLAIPVGQMEAALSLGMTRGTALRRIVIPQAVRLVVPPVTNDFIALFKDTSVCSVITVVELSKRYNILVNSTGAYLELFLVTAVLYLAMSYPLSLLARRLERRSPRAVI